MAGQAIGSSSSSSSLAFLGATTNLNENENETAAENRLTIEKRKVKIIRKLQISA